MSKLVDQIKSLAAISHYGQYRRGPGQVPYIEHPKAVVERLKAWGITSEVMLAAAWAHDLLEDTDVSPYQIIQVAGGDKGAKVLDLVQSLTYDSAKWSSKADWLKHIAEHESVKVMYIKAADRYCNTKDFCKAGKYQKAKSYLLDAWLIVEKISYINKKARTDFAELVDEIETHIKP